MTTTDLEPFTWNGNYKDYSQVERFYPRYCEVRTELDSAGEYPYDACFKGRIPGIEGEREDTAIYLLQGLHRMRGFETKVSELLQHGYEEISALEKTTRFADVVLCPRGNHDGPWAEFPGARVIPETNERQREYTGALRTVMPKGARTRGTFINGRRVLVKRAA